MVEQVTKELVKYAKQSKTIVYSTEVLKKQNNIEVIRRELNGPNGENLWAIILKYGIKEGMFQEVIIGTMGMTDDRRNKTSNIEAYISKQLEQNLNRNGKNIYFEELRNYIEKNHIPFDLSLEGIDILLCKSEEQVDISRTIFEGEENHLGMLYTKTEIDEMKANKYSHIAEEIQRKNEEEHWIVTREKILKNISPEEQEMFKMGEKIAEVVQKTDLEEFDDRKAAEIKGRFKRKVASKYLLDVFDNQEGYDDIQSAKIILLDFYKTMKEKALASDLISTLEVLEQKIFNKSKNQKGQIDERDLREIQELQKYIQFFTIVKRGMDWNARLYALKIGKLDFDRLNLIVERFEGEDSELLEYLKLKEEMMNETQAENIKGEEIQYLSVKKLYKFILNSESREQKRDEEDYLVEKVFEQYKYELIRDHQEAIEIYNHYAKIHGRFVCPTLVHRPEYSDIETLGENENEGSK